MGNMRRHSKYKYGMSLKIYYLYLSKAPAIVKFLSIDLFTKAD